MRYPTKTKFLLYLTHLAGEVKSPTPTSSSQLRNYTPDIFGLMGLSSYVPAEPVEIIDGNSKVNRNSPRLDM